MDDIFLMSPSPSQTQALLDCAVLSLSWARMTIKASKSKSLLITNGKVQDQSFLSVFVNNKVHSIPSLAENPVKFLGRTLSSSLTDKDTK